MNRGRVNHRQDEREHQMRCLRRYITAMHPTLRGKFVERLTARHGADWVQRVREA